MGGDRKKAYVVQVDVDAAEVGKYEVADGIGALDGVIVIIKTVEEPRVLGCNELSRAGVGPELSGKIVSWNCVLALV